jgi:predicted phosphoribosyltransferase
MVSPRFTDRDEAGRALAERLRTIQLVRPLVLAVPCGGVEVGASLAHCLGAELDVVLVRRLAASSVVHDASLGAIADGGEVHLNVPAGDVPDQNWLIREQRQQLQELLRSKTIFRAVRPQADITGRSVILTDDGVRTGATMIAAANTVRAQRPRELIVAVPGASKSRVNQLRAVCDRILCLWASDAETPIEEFYQDFADVHEARVIALLAGCGNDG